MTNKNLSRPKAYSYLRFSTPDQMKGDSRRRQWEATQEYAQKHGLDLDENLTFHDLGKSGYRGKNVEEGRLGDFLSAVDEGQVKPGSFLLVESLDRLSRQAANRAYVRFQDILDKGINIVTLIDKKVYHAGADFDISDMMYSIVIMHRAWDESHTKSDRLSKTWKHKRDIAQNGVIKFTSRCPAWLELDKSSQTFNEIPDRVAVVKRIFQMILDGHGKRSIARTFNEEGVPTFGRSQGWQDSYIQKISQSEAVIGVYQPHHMKDVKGKRKRVPIGEPIEDYFPSIIDKGTFYKARQMMGSRAIPAGRASEKFSNLFTGMILCGSCGAPMHFENKGKPPKGGTYLVCSAARRKVNGCKRHSWSYPKTQAHIILNLTELDFPSIFPSVYQRSQNVASQLEEEIMVKEAELEKIKSRLSNITSLLSDRPNNPALLSQLDSLTTEGQEGEVYLDTLRSDLEHERDTLTNAKRSLNDLSSAMNKYIELEREGEEKNKVDARRRLHQLLKNTVAGFIFTPAEDEDHHGIIDIYLKGTDYHRRIEVEKGQDCSDGYKVDQGLPMKSIRITNAGWPPDLGSIEIGPARVGELVFGGRNPVFNSFIQSLKLDGGS